MVPRHHLNCFFWNAPLEKKMIYMLMHWHLAIAYINNSFVIAANKRHILSVTYYVLFLFSIFLYFEKENIRIAIQSRPKGAPAILELFYYWSHTFETWYIYVKQNLENFWIWCIENELFKENLILKKFELAINPTILKLEQCCS